MAAYEHRAFIVASSSTDTTNTDTLNTDTLNTDTLNTVTTNTLTLRRRATSWVLVVALGLGAVGVVLASTSTGAAGAVRHSGSVDVLYCGSFLDLMEQQIDPAFHQATGYTVSGYANGSVALANEIKGRTQVGDVFISASPSVNALLEGAKNGNWVSSYEDFGYSALVLGYNPSSRFAKDLTSQPWYDVVDRPGFLLGRTDPAIDPKGVLAVDALEGVSLSYDVPALRKLATSSSNVFAEATLVGEVQAGQLDAGFFYKVEAVAGHLRTVPLVATHLGGVFSVAILHRAPHLDAAKAFVRFLLGARARAILRANGVVATVVSRVHAHASARSGVAR